MHTDEQGRVRIPADVDRPDRIVAGLTARQLAILATTAVVLWAGYTATAGLVPLSVFGVFALPVAAAAGALALGGRDGIGFDRLALAALAHLRAPAKRVPAPDGVHDPPAWVEAPRQPLPAPLRLPARSISPDGVIDLGPGGAAVVLECCPLNFALRSAAEQEALVAAFGRYLNSLTSPVQILVRASRIDLGPRVAGLRESAPALPHPALEQAAREHADFLAGLAAHRDLLRRQVLLVVREPPPAPRPGRSPGTQASAASALRRGDEAARALASAGVTATVCGPARAREVLAAACDPHGPSAPAGLSVPGDVVTAKENP